LAWRRIDLHAPTKETQSFAHTKEAKAITLGRFGARHIKATPFITNEKDQLARRPCP